MLFVLLFFSKVRQLEMELENLNSSNFDFKSQVENLELKLKQMNDQNMIISESNSELRRRLQELDDAIKSKDISDKRMNDMKDNENKRILVEMQEKLKEAENNVSILFSR